MVQKLDSLLRRGVAEVIIEQELIELLEAGRPLKLKQGFDPSCPDIHLGHVVGLRKLRQFQEIGHQVILIVGDWTAQIGDPSGQSVTRPTLSHQEVKANAETYMKQFFKVVDKEKTQVRWQSEWFGEFGLSKIIELTSKFTVAQLLAREDFNKRYTSGRPIAVTELLYPLLQAYDSLVIEADVEFGGIDQKFNCLLGRELQAMMGQPPQQLLFVPLLVGTDGSKKMSKSLGNYIGIDEPPKEIYGKVMSIPDTLIMSYFELVTDVPDEELGEFKEHLKAQSVNPMLLKKRLAREIITQFHDAEAAQEADEEFTKVIQKREMPEEIIECRISFERLIHEVAAEAKTVRESPEELENALVIAGYQLDEKGSRIGEGVLQISVPRLLSMIGLAVSRSQAKRLLAQGAIKIDGNTETDYRVHIRDGSVIKVGKRRFVKIVDADKQSSAEM